jgi:hypothetical protein
MRFSSIAAGDSPVLNVFATEACTTFERSAMGSTPPRLRLRRGGAPDRAEEDSERLQAH